MATRPTRISKKSLAGLPPAVAEAVRQAQAAHPTIKSFRVREVVGPYRLVLTEGDTYQFVSADGQISDRATMQSEHNLGAAGLSQRVGNIVEVPVDTVIVNTWYAGRDGYELTLITVVPPPLDAPAPAANGDIDSWRGEGMITPAQRVLNLADHLVQVVDGPRQDGRAYEIRSTAHQLRETLQNLVDGTLEPLCPDQEIPF